MIESFIAVNTMKRHFFRILLFFCVFCGLSFFTSCLKDDPENNKTIYYAYQQIPNINDFMPQSLLRAMGDENLYYGDEPPKIEGAFVANDSWITEVLKTPTSPLLFPNVPTNAGCQYFEFYEQHKGIAKMTFRNPHEGSITEYSSTDTTYSIVSENPDLFINDSIAPVYFKQGNYDKENFHTVYIMGHDPYFTIYYYEIRDMWLKAQPLNAIIISGKVETETVTVEDTVSHTTSTVERTFIKDFRWGIEAMKYYKETPQSLQWVSMGRALSPGDVLLLKNQGNVYMGQYH